MQVRISPSSGTVASADDPSAIFETFYADRLPTGGILGGESGYAGDGGSSTTVPSSDGTSSEPLF